MRRKKEIFRDKKTMKSTRMAHDLRTKHLFSEYEKLCDSVIKKSSLTKKNSLIFKAKTKSGTTFNGLPVKRKSNFNIEKSLEKSLKKKSKIYEALAKL